MATDWIDLECHPSARTKIVRGVMVSIARSESELRMIYRLDGHIRSLRVPTLSAPCIGKELWRHTCFEVFVATEGRDDYHEFNFAPSGEWTVYAFKAYRDGGPLTDETMHPDIATRLTDSRLELDTVVRLDRLSPMHTRALLRIGLSAVIEAIDGGMSYWSLRHPAAKPDFHNADGFALRLDPPGQA